MNTRIVVVWLTVVAFCYTRINIINDSHYVCVYSLVLCCAMHVALFGFLFILFFFFSYKWNLYWLKWFIAIASHIRILILLFFFIYTYHWVSCTHIQLIHLLLLFPIKWKENIAEWIKYELCIFIIRHSHKTSLKCK